MSAEIVIDCACGKKLRAKAEMAGRRGKCPVCGTLFTVPQPPPPPTQEEDDLYALADEPLQAIAKVQQKPVTPPPPPAQPRAAAAAPKKSASQPAVAAGAGGRFLYLVLGVVLIPLIITTLIHGPAEDIGTRLANNVALHPELKDKIDTLGDDATLDDVLALFPNDKLDGAFLARDSWLHWGLALLAAGFFFGAIVLSFPGATRKPLRMAAIGAATGTIGILMLLGFQYIAGWTQGYYRIGFGWITLLFYVVKFIGFSYQAALDPNNGFLLSCIGFTLGVGLCEEICKAMPLLYKYNSEALDNWQVACMCGLASGAGFGVSEAIHYSSHFYNGIAGMDMYWVRFVSCVGLHALWTGGGAIMIFKKQTWMESYKGWEYFFAVLGCLWAPILLHGLYDTLLKKDMQFLALIAAIATFAWFCWQVEGAIRKEDTGEPAFATAR